MILAIRDNSPAYNIPGFQRIQWELMGQLDLEKAVRPLPPDGYTQAEIDTTLYWAPAFDGVTRDVYFGTSLSNVTSRDPSVYKGEISETSYTPPAALDYSTTYYWAIDERDSNGSLLETGDVWSFTTKPTPPPPDIITNLVAHWQLDESSGSAIDTAGGHTGTLYGDPVWQPSDGQISGALELDGDGDYVEATNYEGVTGTNSRTCSAWIKTSTTGTIVSWGTASAGEKWIFRVQDDVGKAGAIRVEVGSGYVVGNVDLMDSSWHHVAAVLINDGSPDVREIKLYVDGQEDLLSATTDEPINTGNINDVQIGAFAAGSNPRYFNGRIDDVLIYERALTPEDIEFLYQQGL